MTARQLTLAPVDAYVTGARLRAAAAARRARHQGEWSRAVIAGGVTFWARDWCEGAARAHKGAPVPDPVVDVIAGLTDRGWDAPSIAALVSGAAPDALVSVETVTHLRDVLAGKTKTRGRRA